MKVELELLELKKEFRIITVSTFKSFVVLYKYSILHRISFSLQFYSCFGGASKLT